MINSMTETANKLSSQTVQRVILEHGEPVKAYFYCHKKACAMKTSCLCLFENTMWYLAESQYWTHKCFQLILISDSNSWIQDRVCVFWNDSMQALRACLRRDLLSIPRYQYSKVAFPLFLSSEMVYKALSRGKWQLGRWPTSCGKVLILSPFFCRGVQSSTLDYREHWPSLTSWSIYTF